LYGSNSGVDPADDVEPNAALPNVGRTSSSSSSSKSGGQARTKGSDVLGITIASIVY
jgi:hypothetical protein